MLGKHLSDLVEALGLEQRAPHEFERLQWSFKDKEFELERKGWEMEKRDWERERERLVENLEREKSKSRKVVEEADAAKESSFGEVGVFWTVDDGALDGSGLLSRIKTVELVGQLREIALGYGRLRFIRAYSSPTASDLPSSYLEALAKLEALGVELRSCLGRNGSSSVIHQVLLDAMLFATSSSTSQITVFLITDNEEFVYLAAKLRMIGCNVIFVCRSMDASKQLLRDVASGVYELDLLLASADPSSSSAINGSAPPPSSTEAPNSAATSTQDYNGRLESFDQEEDASLVVQKEESERSRPPTVEASGLDAARPQIASSFLQSDLEEDFQPVNQDENKALAEQEDQAEDEERTTTPTVDAFGLGTEEEQQPFVGEEHEDEEDPFVYQEEGSLEVETSPVESKDFVEEEASPPLVAEDPTEDLVEEEAEEPSQEVLEDWEIDSPDREEEKQTSGTPNLDVFGFGSSGVVEQQQPPTVEPVAGDTVEEDTQLDSANWGLATPPQPPESSWEGEGWGVPPPPDFHASSKPAAAPTPSSWPPATSSPSPSPSLSPSTSLSQPLPPFPESPKATTTTWASIAKSPATAPLAPLPPPSSPPHFFPETHSRSPTYLNTPSPVPSMISRPPSSRSSRSSFPNPNGLPLDFTPLLQTLASSLPHQRRAHRSKINDSLLENDPEFYRHYGGGGKWKSYSKAAAETGLVVMGVGEDGRNVQWISLTRKGLARIGR